MMAESNPMNYNNMEDLITCSICLGIMEEPTSLPCLHTFCRKCLEQYAKNLNYRDGCPNCRQKFSLTDNGVKHLPKNFLVQNILDRVEQPNSRPNSPSNFDGEKNSAELCKKHPNEPKRFYCPVCELTLCALCMLAQHQDHKCEAISITATRYKNYYKENITEIDKILEGVAQSVSELTMLQSDINQEFDVNEANIKKKFTDMQMQLDRFKMEILNEAQNSRDSRMRIIKANISLLEEQKGFMDSYRETLCECIENKNHYQIVCDGKQLLKEADELKSSTKVILSAKLDMPARCNFIPGAPLQKLSIGEFKPKVKFLLILGLYTGITTEQKFCQISLDTPDTVNVINSTPAEIGPESAACMVNNTLYAVGIGKSRNELWNCSPSRDEWTRCADMPSDRRRHCVTFVGNKIYVLGGWSDAEQKITDSILCYDISSNKWTAAGKLCHAVRNATCVTYKHRVYVFGGCDKDDEGVNFVHVFDSTTGNVTLGPKPLPLSYGVMRAVLWRSKALLIGQHTCYIYNIKTSKWQERKRFKTDVDHFGLTLDDNTLYISGGGTLRSGLWTCKDEVKSILVEDLISDNKKANWEHHANLPVPACISANSSVPIFI